VEYAKYAKHAKSVAKNLLLMQNSATLILPWLVSFVKQQAVHQHCSQLHNPVQAECALERHTVLLKHVSGKG
jgi:hypothetical protein